MATFSMQCDEPLSTGNFSPDSLPQCPLSAEAPSKGGEPHEPAAGEVAAAPLSAGHLAQVAEANQRSRRLRRAAGVAGFNGWSLAVCAVISLPFALFSLSGLIVTGGLALAAWHEFKGRRLLRSFDATAPGVLGWNQLGLMALLVSYSAWSLHRAYTQPGLVEQYPELGGMLLELDSLQRTIALAVYGGLIVGTLLFQGINALYYFGLARHLRDHLERTEHWVLELQRAAGD